MELVWIQTHGNWMREGSLFWHKLAVNAFNKCLSLHNCVAYIAECVNEYECGSRAGNALWSVLRRFTEFDLN